MADNKSIWQPGIEKDIITENLSLCLNTFLKVFCLKLSESLNNFVG